MTPRAAGKPTGDGTVTNEFQLRRAVSALRRGDMETATAMGGTKAVDQARWAATFLFTMVKFERTLQRKRVRQVADEAYGKRVEPGETSAQWLTKTIARFLETGEMGRIRRIAEDAARTRSQDRLAKAVLAGRIDDIHTTGLLNLLWTKYQPEGQTKGTPVQVEAQHLTLEELADEEAAEAVHDPEADRRAIELARAGSEACADQTEAYGITVRRQRGLQYRVRVEGLTGRRAAEEYELATRNREGTGILAAVAIGLDMMYQDARQRPRGENDLGVERIEHSDGARHRIELRITSRLLESYLRRTTRGNLRLDEDIIRTAATRGLEALLRTQH